MYQKMVFGKIKANMYVKILKKSKIGESQSLEMPFYYPQFFVVRKLIYIYPIFSLFLYLYEKKKWVNCQTFGPG